MSGSAALRSTISQARHGRTTSLQSGSLLSAVSHGAIDRSQSRRRNAASMTKPALARFAVRLLSRVASSRDTLNGSNSQSMHRLCFATVWPRCAFQSESHCRYYYKVSRGHVRNRTIDECVLDDQCMPLDRASERNESDPYVRVSFRHADACGYSGADSGALQRVLAEECNNYQTMHLCGMAAECRQACAAKPHCLFSQCRRLVSTTHPTRRMRHGTAAHTTRSRVGQAECGEQARLQG